MKVQVINAEDAKISGVRFAFPGEENLLCSGHFEWQLSAGNNAAHQ